MNSRTKEMTKLQYDISRALLTHLYAETELTETERFGVVMGIEATVKKYIEAAYDNGYNSVVYEEDGPGTSYSELKTKWLKENGITE